MAGPSPLSPMAVCDRRVIRTCAMSSFRMGLTPQMTGSSNNAGALDVVVTADILLAGRCVEKGSHVIGPTGRLYDAGSIGMATAMRNLNQHLRETGEISGHNASFTNKDRSRFLQALDTVIRQKTRSATT